ncbi:MAG: amino acid adenylation domain-containing protein, partial [Myxococcales bacterium]|nr:amino acid adenylation domain-containing protein [Myxococcales bacterium]
GGAYTCIDPSLPDERRNQILTDAQPVAIVEPDRISLGAGSLGAGSLGDGSPRGETPQRGIQPSDLAYLIYTSGTSGRPKGVMIEHAGIANLVAADMDRFELCETDRVAQGSQVAYDSSVEEMWLAWSCGGAVVVLDDDAARLGPDLPDWLAAERITVLCPPPTQLRATGCTHPDLPLLHLLYVGGEALTDDVVQAWAPGRRLENGYGPTECTVTVTRGRIHAGGDVHIGQPVRGHHAHILDEALEPVSPGEIGELCFSGVGLARGYLGAPGLTAQKFIQHPTLGRIYRTGDLGQWLPSGELACLGRLDAQVKVRGHRIELGEVETHLRAQPGVHAAVSAVQDEPGRETLVAFVVWQQGAVPTAAALAGQFDRLRHALQAVVPSHMVPTRFGQLASLPVLKTSGKLDRKSLPRLTVATPNDRPEVQRPKQTTLHRGQSGTLAHTILLALEDVLALPDQLTVDTDFFDAGGHSLAAARLISSLRRRPETATLSVRDIYDAPTAAGLAKRLESAEASNKADAQPAIAAELAATESPRASRLQRAAFTAAQASVLLLGLVTGAQVFWLTFFAVLPWLAGYVTPATIWLLSPLALGILALMWLPLSALLTRVGAAVLLGRFSPGVRPLWGSFHFRLWLVQRLAAGIPWAIVEGTVFKSWLLRVLGADVGERVYIERGVKLGGGGWHLLCLGDDVTIGRDAALRAIEFTGGGIVCGTIALGRGATLGTRAGLSPDTQMGDGAWLTSLSIAPAGTRMPAHTRWLGVPAATQSLCPPVPKVDAPRRQWRPWSHGIRTITAAWLLATLSRALLFIAGLTLLQAVSIATMAQWLQVPDHWTLTALTSLAAIIVFDIGHVLTLAALARALPKPQPGVASLWSSTTLWAGLTDSLVQSASTRLSGSLLWPKWLRLAGMRIGKGSEVSTIIDVSPNLVDIGPGCFFADGIYLGGAIRRAGTATFGQVRFREGAFVGNHAVIEPGATLPAGSLVGVCTVADGELGIASESAPETRQGQSWFGHPPMRLPQREHVQVDRALTHSPSPIRRANRWCWELLRFALPAVPTAAFVLALGLAYQALTTVTALPLHALALPATLVVSAALPCMAVVTLKWSLLGRTKAGQHPLWSCWCSRWDFLYVAWAAWATPIVRGLEGTLLVNTWLRLFGVRIGEGVYLGGGASQVVDPDMLVIRDFTTMTGLFQAHTFEDRVLKTAPVVLEPGAYVAPGAVLMMGCEVGEGARVQAHSVVMKHERLPGRRTYNGAPVR